MIAAAGVASRRESEALIAAGRVTVDGAVAGLGDRADPATARIAIDGVPLRARLALLHLALHKPVGVTSTVRDPHARRTVIDLVRSRSIAPRASTRSGASTSTPRVCCCSRTTASGPMPSCTRATVSSASTPSASSAPLAGDAAAALRSGIELEEGLAQVVHVRPQTDLETRRLLELLDPPAPRLHWYRVTLAQGWKRQIRRMLAAVGTPVVRLVRVRIGPVRARRPATRARSAR